MPSRATHVPVGEDQSQHLEFSRECVTNFNHAYGPHLVAPKTILCKPHNNIARNLTNIFSAPAKRVMSLQEPHLKMSKSHSDPRSKILITDSPEQIHSKIMSALTDSSNSVSYDPENRPAVSNLLQLLSHFDTQERKPEELGIVYANLNLRNFKTTLAETISSRLSPIRKRYEEVMAEDDGAYIDHVQRKGAAKARESAEATMAIVREAVGLH
jgi:tryptophanyl-tRNA synthetase